MPPPPQLDTEPASQRAYLIALLGGPKSPEAKALVEHILETIVVEANTMVMNTGELAPPRATSVARLARATGALLADLFDCHRGTPRHPAPTRGAHGMSKSHFPAKHLGFGYDIFLQVVYPMIAAGLLTQTKGAPKWQKHFDDIVNVGGTVTTYGLTPGALELAASFGITSAAWNDHWQRSDGRPQAAPGCPRLILRAERKRVGWQKLDAKDWPFDPDTPAAQAILTGIERLNDYLRRQTIGGLAFLGLRRIFNNGDDPGFAWNKGGRYYSLPGGHQYEGWSAERRLEAITLNGETVVEVDLSASHLTLLHGLLGRPFDANDKPYVIGEWPKAVVKAWVSQAIGAGNPRPVSWSDRAQVDYEAERPGHLLKDEFPVREVGAAITARHPLLTDLKTCGLGTLDLQFHEAEILRLAMEDLMLRQDIPVLPMHDALIAPRSRAERVREALLGAFSTYVERVRGHPSCSIPKAEFKGLEELEVA